MAARASSSSGSGVRYMTARSAVLLVVAVLACATLYQGLIAVGAVELGSLPGEGAPAGEALGVAVAATILVATFLAVGLAARPTAPRVAALLAPAAAAFLIAHVYTFDPYYLPTLRRYVTDGTVSPLLVAALALLAALAGSVTLARSRIGLALSAPLILACGVTAWAAGLGH
jgi:hypothetical protein